MGYAHEDSDITEVVHDNWSAENFSAAISKDPIASIQTVIRLVSCLWLLGHLLWQLGYRYAYLVSIKKLSWHSRKLSKIHHFNSFVTVIQGGRQHTLWLRGHWLSKRYDISTLLHVIDAKHNYQTISSYVLDEPDLSSYQLSDGEWDALNVCKTSVAVAWATFSQWFLQLLK